MVEVDVSSLFSNQVCPNCGIKNRLYPIELEKTEKDNSVKLKITWKCDNCDYKIRP